MKISSLAVAIFLTLEPSAGFSAAVSTSNKCETVKSIDPSNLSQQAMLDVILASSLVEATTRSLVGGGINVTYRETLERNAPLEQAIPGIHNAMIEAATNAGLAQADLDLKSKLEEARTALARDIPTAKLSRIYYVMEPLTRCNQGFNLQFNKGDTAAAALDRALTNFRSPEVDSRVKQVVREPGMNAALDKALTIIEQYQRSMSAVSGAAAKVAIKAAQMKANEMAAARGYQPIYTP